MDRAEELIRTAALAVLSSAALGQELIWEAVGVREVVNLGQRVVVLGDVDGDLYPDLLYGASARLSPESQLWLVSGRTGQPLWIRSAPEPSRYFRTWTTCGDVDGDGSPDYAATLVDWFTGNPNNLVEVRSALDNRLLWRVEDRWHTLFGFSVLGNLDLDGDGRPDLVVTLKPTPDGEIRCYSHGGSLLRVIPGRSDLPLDSGRDTLLGKVGDVDGDGADDFVAGGGDRRLNKGAAIVFSGRTGQILVMGVDERAGDYIGTCVDGCGDLDGDGVPDFVSGGAGTGRARGVVTAFSGKTGHVIRTWSSETIGLGFEGWDVKSGGIDVDRDGAPDVIVGAPQYIGESGARAAVFVFSGRDGSEIFRFPQPARSTEIGWSVAALGVFPGSPFPCLATSEPLWGAYQGGILDALGRVAVYRGSPAGAQAYGLPCNGQLARAPKIGVRDLGASGARLTVHDAAPGAPVLLLLGVSRTSFAGLTLPQPLGAIGLPGCLLQTSVDVFRVAVTGSTGIAAGYAAVDVPLLLSARGTEVYAQWLCLTAPGAPGAMSDALQWRVQ
jgi:hypothetical protein